MLTGFADRAGACARGGRHVEQAVADSPIGLGRVVLSELAVRDLGVIEDLSLPFDEGMTAVTGETGAGKTLIVGAIDLLVGGRSDASLVRAGAREAEVEGRFCDDGEELVLRRVVTRSGRSRAYVNGRLATVATLAEVAAGLVDLHGQHEHQSLLRSAAQRRALDRFGGIDTDELSRLNRRGRALASRLAESGGDERSRLKEADLLRHQVREIDAAGICGPDEDERLDRAETVLANAAAHKDAAARAVAILDADGPLSEALGAAQSCISGSAAFAAEQGRLLDAAAEIADIAAALRGVAEGIDDDPAALEELRVRRQLLADLRRKHGATLAEVLEVRDGAARRLAELESHSEGLAELERDLAETERRTAAERGRVRARRLRSAPLLSARMQSHLADLAMAAASVEARVTGEAGEDVSFLLAPNPGHDPLPLARSASGGELARAMLALRLVLSDGPATLVFDEVDAGVGGAAAGAVGRSLAALSAEHQVLVVTHLAQVAAHAHCHVSVEKSSSHDVTAVTARRVNGEQRLIELSRMLSGSPDSDAARRHAEELIESAARARQ